MAADSTRLLYQRTSARPKSVCRRFISRADRSRYPDPRLYKAAAYPRRFSRCGAGTDRCRRQCERAHLAYNALLGRDKRCGGCKRTSERLESIREPHRHSMFWSPPITRSGRRRPRVVLVLQSGQSDRRGHGRANRIPSRELALSGETRDLIVADLAYGPFRTLLEANAPTPTMKPPAWRDHVLQLWSPNKLHGLTGVRGAI